VPSNSRAASFKVSLDRALGEAGEQEYARLVRVLIAAQGMFAFVPVASDFPVESRRALLDKLAADLEAKGIALYIASMTRERWDVLQALAEIAPPAGASAVLAVLGLEETPGIIRESGAAPSRPPALALLNHTRESLRARFPFPLILWCEPAVFLALQEEAPDLYDHFIALVEFLYAGPRPQTGEGWEVTSRVMEDGLVTVGPPGSEASAAFYADLLTRHAERSEERARALLGLAEALWGLRTVDVIDRLMRALAAVEEALGILPHEEMPHEVARGQVLKGLILSDLPTANRAESLARAIACYEAALRVQTEEDFPVQWAMTQNNLGIAYQDLPTGDRGANLQKAIACYEAAIRGYRSAGLTGEADRIDWLLIALRHADTPTSWLRFIADRVKWLIDSLRRR
jgi:tetratricopeptide (TPR) repeat protein